jgi:MOSC domain-containing protein YiiM
MRPTGINKRPVEGPVAIGPKGLEGDESGFRSRDRGDTAVHIFAAESYVRFQELAGRPFAIPSFGENLTLEGYSETEARVGDHLRVGTALLRVNQPVVRCAWPAHISGEPRLPKWATAEGYTGFFLDVVEPGHVQRGDAVILEARGPETWTIARLNTIFYAKPADRAELEALLQVPELAERWKGDVRQKLATLAQ